MPDHHLTVVRDFGNYRRGDHIEDDVEILRILDGEHRNHVVKVPADPKPAQAMATVTTRADIEQKSITKEP